MKTPKPKKEWWQKLAEEHARERRKAGNHRNCSCGACLKARTEGYKPE